MSGSATASPARPADTGDLRELELPSDLWVPFEGEPLAIGTVVRVGQPLVASPSQSPSPANGQILGTSTERIVGGRQVPTVHIRVNPASAEAGAPDADAIASALERLSPKTLSAEIDRMLAAGIAVDRWTSPNLLGQLRQVARAAEPDESRPSGRSAARRGSPPCLVLCGALDLDPALPLQRTLAANRAMDIAAGTAALGKLAGAVRTLLAVPEDMSPAGIAALRAAAQASGVRLYPLPNDYPLGNPSLLIRRVTGRRLSPDDLPPEVGVVLLDAPAAVAVGRWFVHGEPMLRVPVGVFDRARGHAHLLRVPIGMRTSDLLRACDMGGHSCELRAGHMLRDVPVLRDAIVGGGEVTIFAADPHSAPKAAACLRCGWCVEACPVDIHPAGLLEAAQQEDPQLAARSGLRSCIECGICSYVCPSRLPLLQSIRALRRGTGAPLMDAGTQE